MTNKAFAVRQIGDDWCIPAALEFVGLYGNLYNHTQTDLVDYASKNGLARSTFADFMIILSGLEPGLGVAHIPSSDFDDWKTIIERESSRTKHVVISVANPPGRHSGQTWHMRVVLETGQSGLRVFDPAAGEDFLKWKDLRLLRERFPGGEDLLVISATDNNLGE